jgi:hypothetical protein
VTTRARAEHGRWSTEEWGIRIFTLVRPWRPGAAFRAKSHKFCALAKRPVSGDNGDLVNVT